MHVGDLVTCEFGCNSRDIKYCLSAYESGSCKGYTAIVVAKHPIKAADLLKSRPVGLRVKVQVCQTGKQKEFFPKKYLRIISSRNKKGTR